MISGEESTPGDDQVSSCSKEDAGGEPGDGRGSHWAFLRSDRISRSSCIETTSKKPIKTDMELMKEKFAKLLLGEDMSGGGKGVPSALALSNAITNLAASVFSEQRKLEPMPDDRKTRWKKEIDWLLSVTDNIVEMVPKIQQTSNGIQLEIMTTQQRTDLHTKIPVLRKLDAMLLDYLENFKDQNEFRYVSKDSDESEKANTVQRNDEKWWLPIVKVPPEGLSVVSRKWLEFQKESVHKIFKAAMAINAQVLSAMEIPENYIESLPKNGRESLGDVLYKGITVESFDPEQLLSTLDMSTEHKTVELKNRIEASVVIWKRKMHNKEKSSLSSSVSLEKREIFEERAETILVFLKQRFPSIPQSTLEDVGHSILVVSKVEKKDVLTGTYMPSTSLTGGYRMLSYLDPSEEKHTQVKTLLFRLLASRKNHVIPEFHKTYSALFENMELEIAKDGKSDFNVGNDRRGFEFLCMSFFGVSPSATDLGTTGPDKAAFWLLFQLHPLVSIGLPAILEEIFLHTFPLPPIFAKPNYNALYKYFSSAATHALDVAESIGLSREEACHNLLFITIFNAYGGIKIFFPGIMKCLAEADRSLHSRLASEIRSAVKEEGGEVTLAAIEKMELTKSVVYEALRINPPVKFQYGKAKVDMTIDSHDARYEVKKGEMLFGYQPFATKDERVFENAEKFVGDRFVGEEGKKLLKYVVWSNGPETEDTTVANKQCAGKNLVVLVGRLLVAELFLRYDTFTGKTESTISGLTVNVISVTSVTKASY